MKDLHVPRIDARYWAGITLASIFGTNTGDLFAHESGLGILGGLPVLAAIVGIAYFVERRDNTRNEVWYWLAIIAIRTGATNIADYFCGRRHLAINRFVLCALLAGFIAGLIWRGAREEKSDFPKTDGRYWAAMLAAGVLGTAAGDAVTGLLGSPTGMGGVMASVILALVLALVLFAGSGGRLRAIHWYWLSVCVARTTGTAVADMLAENKVLDIGLPVCTAVTGALFVGVLLLWRTKRNPQLAVT